MSQPDMFSILLAHPSFAQDQQLLCHLLASSKAVRAAVAKHTAGQLPANFRITSMQQAEQLAAWTKQHGALIKSMVFHPCLLSAEDNETAGSLLAAALQQASSSGALQQLQSFSCYVPDAAVGALVQALPPLSSTLTRLDITPHRSGHGNIDVLGMSSALARMTGLRSLNASRALTTQGADGSCLYTALTSLTLLTELHIGGYKPDQAFHGMAHFLPLQLQRLAMAGRKCQQFQLGHLTALTALEFKSSTSLSVDDVLPPNLVRLGGCFYNNSSLQPLLQLSKLQHLGGGRFSPDELLQSNGLPGLTELQLSVTYDDDDDFDFSSLAAACGQLPVRSLVLQDYYPEVVASFVLPHIRQLQGLTRLQIFDSPVHSWHLVSMLSQLTGMRILKLEGALTPDASRLGDDAGSEGEGPEGVETEGSQGSGVDGVDELVQAVFDLPHLVHLALPISGWNYEGYRGVELESDVLGAKLAAATQLTSLSFSLTPQLLTSSTIVEHALRSLTQLRDLSLFNIFRQQDVVPDGVLEAIATLSQLTSLCISDMHPRGCEWAARRKRLEAQLPNLKCMWC